MTIKELKEKLEEFEPNENVEIAGIGSDGGQAALAIENVDFVEQRNSVMIFASLD